MKTELKILHSVELAAIKSYQLIGMKSDKNKWDEYSVKTLRMFLNDVKFKGKVVIGEGKLDSAPLLYNGEILGKAKTPCYDLAVDPIEGTFPASENIRGSIVTLCLAKENTILSMPEFYMEKFFTTSFFKECVDLKKGLSFTVKQMQKKALGRTLRCFVIDRPRHTKAIKELRDLGVLVKLIKDGDVVAAIDTVFHKADFVYGIGSAPEGALMASLALAVGGTMEWSLHPFDSIYPQDVDLKKIMAEEKKSLKENKLSYGKVYNESHLVKDKKTLFIATGLTGSEYLDQIHFDGKKYKTHSVIASCGVVHDMYSVYNLDVLKENYPLLNDVKFI